jgi:hypothetical protein
LGEMKLFSEIKGRMVGGSVGCCDYFLY